MPNEAPFDPCRQWLGIDAVDLGDARRVLGVSGDERDPLVVLRAAEARLSLLRKISPGPFERARAGLVTRVEEAREKVLAEIAAGPGRPSASAVERFAMPPPPSTLGAAAPQAGAAGGFPPTGPAAAATGFVMPRPPGGPPVPPVPVAPPVPAVPAMPTGGEQIRIRTAVYRKETPVAGIVAAMLMLAGVAGGLAYYFVEKGKQKAEGRHEGGHEVAVVERKDKEEKPVPKPKPPRDPVSNMQRVEDRRVASPPADDDEDRPFRVPAPEDVKPAPRPGKGKKNGEKKPGTDMMAKGDEGDAGDRNAADAMPGRKPARKPADTEDPPEDTAAVKAALAKLDKPLGEALAALRDKDMEQAAAIIEEAAAKAGRGPAADRAARWQQLVEYAQGYYKFREQALAAVKSGNEYDVNNQKVAVVEADDQKFVYRSAGGNKTVTHDKIPAGIVLAIVTDWFDDKPANHLYLGAYHLAKPESDPARARKEFEMAEAGGADASGLLPLVDDPLFAAKSGE